MFSGGRKTHKADDKKDEKVQETVSETKTKMTPLGNVDKDAAGEPIKETTTKPKN